MTWAENVQETSPYFCLPCYLSSLSERIFIVPFKFSDIIRISFFFSLLLLKTPWHNSNSWIYYISTDKKMLLYHNAYIMVEVHMYIYNAYKLYVHITYIHIHITYMYITYISMYVYKYICNVYRTWQSLYFLSFLSTFFVLSGEE